MSIIGFFAEFRAIWYSCESDGLKICPIDKNTEACSEMFL